MASQGVTAFEGRLNLIPGLKCVTDLSTAGQFCFVKMSANMTVALATDDTVAIGVLQNNTATSPVASSTVPQAVEVAGVGSVTKLKLGGTVTYGQKLTPNSDGTGSALAVSEADDPVCAIALEGGSSGNYIAAYLCGGTTLAAS